MGDKNSTHVTNLLTIYVYNSDMTALDDDGEDSNVCWVHARYSCSLRQGFWMILLKLLTAFKAN